MSSLKKGSLNFSFPGEQMPFYVILTIFRVLSISLAIVTLGYVCIPLYAILLLLIIIIGYIRTSKDADFVVRGLRSAVTTGTYSQGVKLQNEIYPNFTFSVDDRYQAEWFFQVFWLVVNIILVLTIKICLWGNVLSVDVAPWLFDEHWGVKNNIWVMNMIVVAGVVSFAIFEWQRHCDMTPEQESLESREEGECLFDKVLDECKNRTRPFGPAGTVAGFFNGSLAFGLSVLEYFSALTLGLGYISSGDSIWGVVTLIIPFLPGVEWHSRSDLAGSHRLTWLLSSILFPLTVIISRVGMPS